MNIFDGEIEHFNRTMRDIGLEYGDDKKVCREKMIAFMCETLEKFGCEEGVRIFQENYEH